MKALKIGNLTARIPIIQGGMGVCVSLSGLASAVANEGGIGVISAVGIGMTEPNYRNDFRKANQIALAKEIRKARNKTKGIIGVNIMLAISDFEDLLKTAIDEKADCVFIGAGLPLKKPSSIKMECLESTETKFIPKVSSARAAKLIFQYWSNNYNRVPDAIVVEGMLSGGHQGFKKNDLLHNKVSLSKIVNEVIDVISPYEISFNKEIPVIAGGGIYTGEDVLNILNAGANGVKMGTRFVTTTECDVAQEFKQNYISCNPQDITLIDSPVGLPARVISNEFVSRIQKGMQQPTRCPWKCLKTCNFKTVQFCIAEALFNAAKGNFKEGFSFAGTNAYLANKITSVKETFNQIICEYQNKKVLLTME